MKLPSKVKIGAHTYTVEYIESNDSLESENSGHCDFTKGKITIQLSEVDTINFATFLHECLHAMNNEIEHETIESLSQQLTQFLLENKIVNK